ncbi:c-type cytochrome [Crocinitomix catalasitica]|uniref:c-type cytochrome n=1 Tax=Crocinitomix catalasitica TaxID=184607 RepID=UPI0012FC0581|nr:c-type cytochrome [Crocinitomix catalasitica]
MKLKNLFISSKIKLSALVLIVFVSFSSNLHAQTGDAEKGKKIFSGFCASCHFPDKDMTGPALKGARERWIENSSEENFYAWVKNSSAVIASGDSYASGLFAKWGSVMTPQALTNEQIDDVMAYIDGYTPPVAETPTDTGLVTANTDESSSLYWWLFAGLLVTLIAVVGGIKGNLLAIARKEAGDAPAQDLTMGESAKSWAWRNRGWFGVTVFIAIIGLLAMGMVKWLDLGVYENYKPVQPISYSHELHAGKLGIDCKYCHNSVTKSKHATIPSVNVCMNCHKTVTEGSTTGTEEIAKIHKAAGYDVATSSYTGETEPIEWVKVHNLPDHVYFSHQQHVVAGGIDCKQCHGNMKKQTVAKVMSTEDLNNVGVTDTDYDENDVKFTKPTLTMGWCIECHKESNIDIANAPDGSYYNVIHERLLKDKKTYQKYLEDDKVSVAELGGLECAKCHY